MRWTRDFGERHHGEESIVKVYNDQISARIRAGIAVRTSQLFHQMRQQGRYLDVINYFVAATHVERVV